MKLKSRFLWFATATFTTLVLVFGAILVLFWKSLATYQQEVIAALVKVHFSYIFSAGVLLLAALGFILDWFFRLYIIPISRLSEEVALMLSVNPDFRTQIDGSQDVARLGQLINKGADLYQGLKDEVAEQVRRAQAEAQVEKNILATIVAELPEGVLICNDQGQILLYNRRAKQFLGRWPGAQLSHTAQVDASQPFLGLGRSIFGVIDKRLVVHALDEIALKLERQAPDLASYFIVVGQGNELLRTEVIPILDQEQLVTGLILLLTDITARVAQKHGDRRRQQELMHSLRGGLATVRCSAELLAAFDDIDPSRQAALISLIADQSKLLGDMVKQTCNQSADSQADPWPMAAMLAEDLLTAIRRRAADLLKLPIDTGANRCQTQVKLDSYAMVLAVTFLLAKLRDLKGGDRFDVCLETHGDLIFLDICYPGETLSGEALRQWRQLPLTVGDESLPLTLEQVLSHHGAELWSSPRDTLPPGACLRLYLPASDNAETDRHIQRMTILPQARPEFYDFDLFHQPGQTPHLDKRPLTELSYTVFDTETTGLDPRGGDEIISIGAVRIVNGRLLHEEFFDQLVDPQRSLPYASVKIHGIQEKMLENQPTIERVLNIFLTFCEETILVAHNAAFDMRMLQLKEAETGVRFINPVLDTMHLSAVVHPAHADHSISAIAERLGISVVGRHTALGDAITTAEIFLKQIPLLAEKGITTLAEARLASQRTYYARLKY